MVDQSVRDDLNKGFITSERDYVSNLTSGIRHAWGWLGFRAVCYARSLKGNEENWLGCDALIVLRSGAEVKVGLFEAKWPRLAKDRYKWDYLQADRFLGTMESHFTNQLNRQRGWHRQAAIWELFILEHLTGDEPPYFDASGATCVWHSTAYKFDSHRRKSGRIWDRDELKKLLEYDHRRAPNPDNNLRDILAKICACRAGSKIVVNSYGYALLRQDENPDEGLLIPADYDILTGQVVADFCRSNRLSNFLFLQLE
jgi:hypothetical protein